MVLCHKLLRNIAISRVFPWFAFLYMIIVLVLTMGTMNPVLLVTSLIASALCEIRLAGSDRLVRFLPWLAVVVSVTTIGNMLISHNGKHALFMLNGNRVTVEAAEYGLVFGIMFAAAFLWSDIMQTVITGEKLTYMFGSIAPNIGLLISMTLHYIPLMRRRLETVHQAQTAMGRGNKRNIFERARQMGKELSIVISWSLENAIETGSIMTAMGYGTCRRSSYSGYRVKKSDFLFLTIVIMMAIPSLVAVMSIRFRVYFYPSFGTVYEFNDMLPYWIFYILYMLIPTVTEGRHICR